jgi:hypothetical protein
MGYHFFHGGLIPDGHAACGDGRAQSQSPANAAQAGVRNWTDEWLLFSGHFQLPGCRPSLPVVSVTL